MKKICGFLFGGLLIAGLMGGAAALYASQDGKKEESPSQTVSWKDGIYKGEAKGYKGPIEVEVKVKDGKIASVKILKQKENQPGTALTEIPAKIVKGNGPDGIDAITGATFTSNGIMNAVKAALAKAK